MTTEWSFNKSKLKNKIQKIIADSKSNNIENLFSEKTFADVPTGTYYFYIDNYEIGLTWLWANIAELFDYLQAIITTSEDLLFTIDYKGSCSYILTLQKDNNNIELLFLDRIEPKCRNNQNRYSDNSLKKTIVIKHLAISKIELIKQFNEEFKTIYNENKYYLSQEYKDKCEREKAIVCQEYVLETFAKFIPIFDEYVKTQGEL